MADFLRRRRAELQPEQLGLPRTGRRRAPGLRREEVAAVAGMSTDYLARLEQARGPQPSPSVLVALARALLLTRAESDHLHRLAGRAPAAPEGRTDTVPPGLARVLERVAAPAMVTNDLGEVLAQNPLAVALFGDERRFAEGSPERSRWYRWFTDPAERSLHAPTDHDRLARSYVAGLRLATGRRPADAGARRLVELLQASSPHFAALWQDHDVTWRAGSAPKHLLHPEVGALELDCEVLHSDDGGAILLVYTAAPGSPSAQRLDRLAALAPST